MKIPFRVKVLLFLVSFWFITLMWSVISYPAIEPPVEPQKHMKSNTR